MPRLLIVLVLLLAQRLVAQTPFTRIYFADTTNTTGLIYGKCLPIQATGDGGYLLRYLIGQPIIDGEGFDYMIEMKTDAALVPQWHRKVINSTVLSDGSIMANLYSFDDTGTVVERRTATGSVLWQRRLWTPFPGFVRFGESVEANGHVRYNGYTSGAASTNLVADVDAAGNLIRVDSLTGEHWPAYIERIFTDDSGNYYYVLWATGTTSMDSRKVAKIRPDNSVAWCRQWITSAGWHRIAGVVRLPGGDALFAGNYRSSAGEERAYLLRVTAGGNIVWQKTTDRPCRPDDLGILPNGEIAIAAGGQSYTSMSIPVEDNIIVMDTAAMVKRIFNVDPYRTTWPYYTGLSLPYVRSANEWLFAALAMQPHAPVVFSTDSMGIARCASASLWFKFNNDVVFTFAPATIAFAPMALSIENVVLPTDGTPIAYWDSCDYGMPLAAAALTETGDKVLVLPNPANQRLQLQGRDIEEAVLIDMWGRTVATMPPNSRQINVSSLPHGVYTLLAAGNGKKYYERVVVVH